MVPPLSSEAEILHEAKMLREHKDRLNSRMKLLEVHNNQLEMQLGKLRQLLSPADSSQQQRQHPTTDGVGGSGNHPQPQHNDITANKTGTLNTKAVTASELATNSPILPHKLNGNNAPSAPPTKGDPPALPPRGVSIRSRDGSLVRNSKPPPPAVPPKRSSLTRSDLALFSDVNPLKYPKIIKKSLNIVYILFRIEPTHCLVVKMGKITAVARVAIPEDAISH